MTARNDAGPARKTEPSLAGPHVRFNTDEAEALFSKVAKNFRLSLSPQDRTLFREYDSPEAMIRDLETSCRTYKDKHWLSKLCGRIDYFASLWNPFFAVVGTFVQSNPEYAALAWGAIRLVFLLGSNFRTFLEKILVMFEKITDRLPLYRDYYEQVIKRWDKVKAQEHHRKAYESRKLRVAKSVGYVYADMIEFCHDACKIFSAKRGGIRYKTSVIADVFWKPFDLRFADLLDRMHSHQSLLHSELMLEDSTFTEIQFEQRKLDAEISQEVMGQIKQQLTDLSADISSKETAIMAAFQDFIRRLEGATNDQSTSAASAMREAEFLELRVTQLKKWIDAPDYMLVLERATACRAQDTCRWFACAPEYQAWKLKKRQSRAERDDWQTLLPNHPLNDILFVTAKPGFGKTTLSSFIIEDLSPSAAGLYEASYEGVLFYHFHSQTGNDCDPIHALRAMLAQLVHLCRKRKDVIDALSLLYEDNNIGHITASENQVMECLVLVLGSFSDVVILVDGIDECSDGPGFLSMLATIHAKIGVKALLFSRPTIDISDSLPSYTSFDLDISKNRADISRYLTPHINRLRDKKLLPAEYEIQHIVEKLATKSTGMFLWATLMIKYLNCNALSPNDRREAIFDNNIVEGIEGIYNAILSTLEKSYARQRERVQKIFWLVAVALRPLGVLELQFAISIKPGSATKHDDLIPNLESALPSMCGALVEVLPNETVAFIHLSFRDFITTPVAQMASSPFFVDVRRRNLDAACVFLSYQVYDVPRSPLKPGRVARETDASAIVATIFPLVRYALSWPQHLVEFTKQSPPEVPESSSGYLSGSYSTLLSLLANFTKDPLCVTAWIESSWMFRSIPSMGQLVQILAEETLPFSELLPRFPRLLADMQIFASDLVQLNKQWGHLLSKDPSAIWTSSITAFTKSDFWYQTGDFQVACLAPRDRVETEMPSALLIQSRLSSSGDILGIVQVTPSRQYVDLAQTIFGDCKSGRISDRLVMSQKRALIKLVTRGWKVRYEQKSVVSEKTIMAIEHELHPDEIQGLLQQSLASNQPDRFPFPVAMSNDLRRVVILRTLCTVHSNGELDESGSTNHFKTQCLGSSTLASDTSGLGTVSYSPLFSPDGSALVFAMRDVSTGANQIQRRRLELWAQERRGQEDSEFVQRAAGMAVWFDISPQIDNVAVRGLVFHPSLPLLVFPTWSALTAWWFDREGRDFLPSVVVARVSGLPERFHTYSILEYSMWTVADFDDGMAETDPISDITHDLEPQAPERRCSQVDISWFLDLNKAPPDTEHQALSINTSSVLSEHQAKDRNSPLIRRDHMANAVVWLPKGAATESRVLLHLPRLVPGEQTLVSLLEFSQNDEWVRMVWNQAQQDSYSVRDERNPYLPAIISRKRAALDQPAHMPKRATLPSIHHKALENVTR